LSAHTKVEDVGPVAERAGVRTLVLSHLVPGNRPDSVWRAAQQGFSGRLVIGHDLDEVGIGERRSRPGLADRRQKTSGRHSPAPAAPSGLPPAQHP
jgi:hypothetical protein